MNNEDRGRRNKTNETKPLIILKSPMRSVTMMRVAKLNLGTAQQLLTDKRDHSLVLVKLTGIASALQNLLSCEINGEEIDDLSSHLNIERNLKYHFGVSVLIFLK